VLSDGDDRLRLLPAHLVRREQVLVVDQPERREGEGGPEFARRCQNERVLALNPNFSVE
jgi:hypothetical protein